MNGPQHFAEAERLLEAWQQTVDEIAGDDDASIAQQVAEGAPLATQSLLAVVGHALLAHTAAVASFAGTLRDEWSRVLYPQPATAPEATP